MVVESRRRKRESKKGVKFFPFSKGMRQDQKNPGLPKSRGRKPCNATTSKTVKSKVKKMMTIQGLIWNCRGLRKKGVATYLKNLMSLYSFHFIGLQETMIKDCDEKLLRKFDPQQQYLWLYNSAKVDQEVYLWV